MQHEPDHFIMSLGSWSEILHYCSPTRWAAMYELNIMWNDSWYSLLSWLTWYESPVPCRPSLRVRVEIMMEATAAADIPAVKKKKKTHWHAEPTQGEIQRMRISLTTNLLPWNSKPTTGWCLLFAQTKHCFSAEYVSLLGQWELFKSGRKLQWFSHACNEDYALSALCRSVSRSWRRNWRQKEPWEPRYSTSVTGPVL